MDHPIANRSKRVSQLDTHEKLFAAISVLQAHILSLESCSSAEQMFGVNHLKEDGLRLVERLLQDLALEIPDDVLSTKGGLKSCSPQEAA